MIHAYQKIGEYRKALHVAQLMPKNFTWPDPLFSWTIMAVCYARTGNLKECHRLLDSIATRKNLSAYERYYTNFEFGVLELHYKNLVKAERHALYMHQAALEIYIDSATLMAGSKLVIQQAALKLRADKKILEAELLLYQVYKAANNTDLALRHLERVRALEKKLAAKTSKQVVEELQLKYNAERLQAENERNQQARTRNFLLVGLGLLTLFAGYAAWSNWRLRQKTAEISAASLQGQTLERRRVAADLHDSLGGLLTSLRWQMQQVDEQSLDEKQRGIFQTTLQNLTEAYQRVRLISHNLLPDELEKQGLAQGLQHLVRTLNGAGGIQIDLEINGLNERLPKQTEFELYSISLELLTNVLKHAGATEAFLALDRQNGTLDLTVSDNGRGWDGQTTDGHGWKNIQNRLDSLGGQVTVQPRAGTGTEVQLTIPV
ncbi:MAG: sensor histidine kinase [Cytophagaceae bacterium]|nr:sensor histidine kinase [Cytophagaceae bacterium]